MYPDPFYGEKDPAGYGTIVSEKSPLDLEAARDRRSRQGPNFREKVSIIRPMDAPVYLDRLRLTVFKGADWYERLTADPSKILAVALSLILSGVVYYICSHLGMFPLCRISFTDNG